MARVLKLQRYALYSSILFIAFLLCGCQVDELPTKNDENYVYNSIMYDVYSVGNACNTTTNIEFIDSYQKYQNSDIQHTYDEVFFENNSLVYISNVEDGVSDTITIQDMFLYNQQLNIMYWTEGALTAVQCYDIVIQIENIREINDVNAYFVLPITFVSSSGNKISIYEIDESQTSILFQYYDNLYFLDVNLVVEESVISIHDITIDNLSIKNEILNVEITEDGMLSISFMNELYVTNND